MGPAGGCAGAATLPTACRALQLHSFLPGPLHVSITGGTRHLKFYGQAAPEKLFGCFSPTRGTQGGFLPGPDIPEAGNAWPQSSKDASALQDVPLTPGAGM